MAELALAVAVCPSSRETQMGGVLKLIPHGPIPPASRHCASQLTKHTKTTALDRNCLAFEGAHHLTSLAPRMASLNCLRLPRCQRSRCFVVPAGHTRFLFRAVAIHPYRSPCAAVLCCSSAQDRGEETAQRPGCMRNEVKSVCPAGKLCGTSVRGLKGLYL